ncbi:MAG TPA: TIGR03016 family PEP-CTERM system-associated outer membrane protein [Dissulfurispiraceae bacterium]
MRKKAIRFLVAVLCACCWSAAPVYGAEFQIQPAINLSEEYNDNIYLSNENKTADYITWVNPSIALKYEAPLWTWDARYAFDYLYYARRSRHDDRLHSLNIGGLINVLKDRAFLKLGEDYNRVSLDITRDLTKESPFLNLSDRNLFTLNPYFILKPSERVSITTGYIYANTWYKERAGVSKVNHIVSIEPSYELSPKLSFSAGYRYTREDSDTADFDRNDLYLGSKCEYAGGSNVFFRVGNSWLKFPGIRDTSNVFWNAGITHNFTHFTGSLETSSDYTENPLGTVEKTTTYLAAIRREFKRTALNISIALTEYKDPETRQFDTRKYGTTGSVRYEISSKATGALDLTVEKLEDKVVNSYIRRYLVGLKLDYLFWKDTTLDFSYNYTDSHSPKILSDKYKNNRLFIGIRKSFWAGPIISENK